MRLNSLTKSPLARSTAFCTGWPKKTTPTKKRRQANHWIQKFQTSLNLFGFKEIYTGVQMEREICDLERPNATRLLSPRPERPYMFDAATALSTNWYSSHSPTSPHPLHPAFFLSFPLFSHGICNNYLHKPRHTRAQTTRQNHSKAFSQSKIGGKRKRRVVIQEKRCRLYVAAPLRLQFPFPCSWFLHISSASSERRMGSGRAWTSEENVMAYRAFVSSSENSRRGVSRKVAVFKKRIQNAFGRIQRETTGSSTKYVRTGSALFERYKNIKKECLVFEECSQWVNQAHLTGNPTEEQILNASTAFYNNRANIRDLCRILSGDPVYCGNAFFFISACKYLRSINLCTHMLASMQAAMHGTEA